MKRLLLLILLVVFSVFVFADDLSGTGWIFEDDDGERAIVLFDSDGTFSYVDVLPHDNQRTVWNEDDDTFTVTGDLVVVSFTDGYRICSMTLNSRLNRMSGTCINKVGLVNETAAKLIE